MVGKIIVVVGYGWCGKGIVFCVRGLGVNVVVIEIDLVCVIEVIMDGFWVMLMVEVVFIGDLFIIVIGNKYVICGEYFDVMKDGVIVCNFGYFDIEIDLEILGKNVNDVKIVRFFI